MASINFYLDVPYKPNVNQKVKELKKNKKSIPVTLLSEKETSIYLILTLPKKVVKMDRAKLIKVKTEYQTFPRYWNFETKLPNGKGTGDMELKAWLEELRSDVRSAYINLKKQSEDLSLDKLEKAVYSIVKREETLINSNDLFEVFKVFLIENPKIKTERTRQKYNTLIKLLKQFEIDKEYKINFESINKSFFAKYLHYLEKEAKNPKSEVLGFLNNTINKYVADFKTFLSWAFEEDYHKNKYFMKMNTSRDETEVITLEFEEFQKLLNYKPVDQRLQETKDVFLSECLTAQRYQDMYNLSREDIKDNVWRLFQSKGRKTRSIEIPLHPIVQEILGRYKNHFKPLPVISNQKYNDNIKELCEKAEIDSMHTRVRYSGDIAIKECEPKYKFLSSHSGRKTFINIAAEMGIQMEVAMSITGHKDYKVVQEHYRKVSMKEKQAAMDKMDFSPNLKVV